MATIKNVVAAPLTGFSVRVSKSSVALITEVRCSAPSDTPETLQADAMTPGQAREVANALLKAAEAVEAGSGSRQSH